MTRLEEIKSEIRINNIELEWLAEQVGLNTRQLNYFLNEVTDLDDQLYENLKEAIEEAPFEMSLFESDIQKDPSLFEANRLNISIGERIKTFAKKKYGKMTRLANAMEITPQQLHQYTSGNREPGSKILIKLLNLGCDLNWLLGGVEKPESYKLAILENEIKQLKEKLAGIAKIASETNHKKNPKE